MVFRYLFSLFSLLLLLAVNPYSLAAAAAVRRQRSNRTSDRWIHESSSHRNSSKNASSPEGVPDSVAELGRDRNSSETASSPERRDGSPVPGSMVEIGRETGSMVVYQDAQFRGMKLFMEGLGTKALTPFINHGVNKLMRMETCNAFDVVHKCAECVKGSITECLENDCLKPFVDTNKDMIKEAESEENEMEKTEKEEKELEKKEKKAGEELAKKSAALPAETPEEKAEKADNSPKGKKAASNMKKAKNNLVKFHWLRSHLDANKDKAGQHKAGVDKALDDSKNTAADVSKFLDNGRKKTCKKGRYKMLCQGVDKHMEGKKDAVTKEIVNPKCKGWTLEDGSKKTAIRKKSFLETDATYMLEDSELSDEMDKHADAFQDCPSDTFNAFRSKLALQGSDPLHLDEYKDIFESSESLLAAQSHPRPSAAAAFNNATGFVKGVGQAALYVYCAGRLPYTTTEAKYCEDNLNGLPNPNQALIESGDTTEMRVWGEEGEGDGEGDEGGNEPDGNEPGTKSNFWKKTFFGLGMVGALAAGGLLAACLAFPATTGICAPIVGTMIFILVGIIVACVVVAAFAVAMAAFS